MSDAGMDVINPSGHRLNGRQFRRHQAFRHRTPMAQIRCEPKTWMAGQPSRHPPGLEQGTTAMRLERHRDRTGINLIQNAVQKAMLGFIPAVAASDQSDFERVQCHGPIQASPDLIKMLRWRAVEIGGVIPPVTISRIRCCCASEKQPRIDSGARPSDRVVEIDFKAVKTIAEDEQACSKRRTTPRVF